MDPDTSERHECITSSPAKNPTIRPSRQECYWAYLQDGLPLNRTTLCPKCGETVYFVRHNGGSVWFDELGPPWPKHPCFDDEPTDALLRAEISLDINEKLNTFGVIAFAKEADPGHHRYIIKCADGSTIDTEFESGWNLSTLPGTLVHINRSDNNIIISQLSTIIKPVIKTSLRIRSLTPYSTGNWLRKIVNSTELSGNFKIKSTESFVNSHAMGLNLHVIEHKGSKQPFDIILECESRRDLAFYIINLSKKKIPYEVFGSQSANNLEVNCKSPDGFYVVARIQPK